MSRLRYTPLARTLLAVLAAVALPQAALAAHPDAWADSAGTLTPAAAAHRPGRWSLDFAINDNFTLGSFKGSALSATRTTSPNGAWRVGLGYAVSTNDLSGATTQLTDSSTAGVLGSHNDRQAVSLTGVVMRLHRFHPARRIAAYLGVGPSVSWNRNHDEYTQDALMSNRRDIENDYAHSVSLGVAADLGVEAFAARDISLFAQYGATGGYSFGKFTRRSQALDATTGAPLQPLLEHVEHTHGWQLGANGVRFGLSLYL